MHHHVHVEGCSCSTLGSAVKSTVGFTAVEFTLGCKATILAKSPCDT